MLIFTANVGIIHKYTIHMGHYGTGDLVWFDIAFFMYILWLYPRVVLTWFKETLLSPSRRSLNHWKGHLKGHNLRIAMIPTDSQTFFWCPGEIFKCQNFRKRRKVPSCKWYPSSTVALAFLLVAHHPARCQRNEIHYPTAIGQWRADPAECEC